MYEWMGGYYKPSFIILFQLVISTTDIMFNHPLLNSRVGRPNTI